MSTFKNILRTDYKTISGYSKIYIRYTHQSKWFDIPTGQSCRAEEWNKEKGEPRRNHPYRLQLMNELEGIKNNVIKLKDSLIRDGKEVSVENLKEIIKKGKKPKKTKVSVKECWENYLNHKRSELTKSTLTIYLVTWKHLINFCHENKKTLSWSVFNEDFEPEWNLYFFEKEISNGTNGKYFKTLKTFLHWAYKKKHIKNESFKNYKIKQSTPEIFPLLESELKIIDEYLGDLNNNCSERENKIGSMFLFMCYSSLRYSDVQRLTFSMIQKGDNEYMDGIIRMDTQKTDKNIIIPITPQIYLQIRRNNVIIDNRSFWGITFGSRKFGEPVKITPETKVFPSISNQKFNQYIKELCEKLNLDRNVRTINRIGKNRIYKNLKLWETISAHTGRRTFITLSLEKGMRPETIMKITGHNSIKTMYRYNEITSEIVKEEMMKHHAGVKEKDDIEQVKRIFKEYIDENNRNINEKISKNKKPINQEDKKVKKSISKNPFIPPKNKEN